MQPEDVGYLKARLMFFRSHLVLYYLLSSVATAIASLRESPVPPQGKHNNLLVILTDQQRYDTLRFVQEERGVPEKARIRTPNLDRIAREGGTSRSGQFNLFRMQNSFPHRIDSLYFIPLLSSSLFDHSHPIPF